MPFKKLLDVEEVEQTGVSSVLAGLLAKVAYADLNIKVEEEEIMTRILEETLSLDSSLLRKLFSWRKPRWKISLALVQKSTVMSLATFGN